MGQAKRRKQAGTFNPAVPTPDGTIAITLTGETERDASVLVSANYSFAVEHRATVEDEANRLVAGQGYYEILAGITRQFVAACRHGNQGKL